MDNLEDPLMHLKSKLNIGTNQILLYRNLGNS